MDKKQKYLYCIALLPDSGIRNQIQSFKKEMQLHFNAGHALRSPAHITLQMPFRRGSDFEEAIIDSLHRFASGQAPFKVTLSGFGCFAPKVIFVKISDHEPVVQLHSGLIRVLKDEIGLSEKEIMSKVFPHMTIATRDLTRKNFKAAWKDFELRSFNTDFDARSLHLLKHNGKSWDIYREFKFDA